MWNMNIHCYFIIGKPKHQEEVGLVVTTVCGLVLLKKKVGQGSHPSFFFFFLVPQQRDCGIPQTLH